MSGPIGRAKEKLRISYLFSHFPLPTESFAVSDILALRELGHEVFVHTMRIPRKDEKERELAAAVPADLPIFRPSIRGALAWPMVIWRSRREAAKIAGKCLRAIVREPKAAVLSLLTLPRALEIAEEIGRIESDVVHLFWSRYAANVLEILKIGGATPVRSAFVGAYDLVDDDLLVDTAIASAQTLFSHSESNRAYLEGKGASRSDTSIVHRGIPLIELDEHATRDPDLWVTASALVAEKNVCRIIEAFARAHRHRPELRLAICGDGPERTKLEDLTRELGCETSVRFLGHVPRAEVFDLFQRAGLCLLLSTKPSERLPNVVKEAMWCGAAIIASPTQGIEELIIDDGLGAIVDPDDAAALDRAIANALKEDAATGTARRERSRRLIAERFSNITNMARYVENWCAAQQGSRVDDVMRKAS